MQPGKRKIYTLGTSTRTFEEFISLLKSFGIDLIIDVRRFPTSRFEWFKKENLETLLSGESIQYLYMGKEFGGYRSGGYEAYTQSEEFQKALAALKEVSTGRNGAIVCAERFPWKCHRLSIARELEKLKFDVIHIIDEKRTWRPKRRK
ncbi:MAG: hypothetical protein AMS15_04490 [Planctomycetes bacterium DG_23]|nr:MAG: hypothetical protein AMS15_04490 [Planctomycetes bacterium DG_23]